MIETQVCIVGGGPAGMMLGYLLARAGVDVVVLEKHADFLRDFRGDTVHPSTLEILAQCGLSAQFAAIPQNRVQQLSIRFGTEMQRIVDFRGLRPFDYLALVPQWDFLNLLATNGAALPSFHLYMEHAVDDLVTRDGRVVGVSGHNIAGAFEVRAGLTVACDGRSSTVCDAAGMSVTRLGAPMDVLWFRLPRAPSETDETFGTVRDGHILVLLNRIDYWQAAFVVPKGTDLEFRQRPLSEFCSIVAGVAPQLSGNVGSLASWDDVKTLEVSVNRLEKWYQPGLLAIGDAAHAMSPIGGVGINLAIQDAVAAANTIVRVLAGGEGIQESHLAAVQRRRMAPTKIIQTLQIFAQRRIISPALARRSGNASMPAVLRWLLRFRWLRNIPARLIGYGVRRERVEYAHRP